MTTLMLKPEMSCEALGRCCGDGTYGATALRMDSTSSLSFGVQTLFESLGHNSFPRKSYPKDDKCSIEGKQWLRMVKEHVLISP